MQRVTDPADPRRCQGNFPDSQCWNFAEHGSDYCAGHGGVSTALIEEQRMYNLVEVQHRQSLTKFADHDAIKSLREEIGLVRLLIERRLNLVKNDTDLMAACGPVNTMLLTVERLVKSAHSLEQSLGSLLSKQTVARLGQALCQIVVEELEGIENYEAIIDRISERVVSTISKANNNESQLALPAPLTQAPAGDEYVG